jgi:hypothetical protein
LRAVATDDLHAPLGLKKPTADRPIVYSVAAAVLGIAAAAAIGATAWYAPLTRSLPTAAPATAATPAGLKPEAAVVAPGTGQSPSGPPPRSLPQVTGSIPPAGTASQPAAPGSTDRIITIIDGTSGARREVRIPATSDTADPPLADPGLVDLMPNAPSADEAPEASPQRPPQPSHAKPNAPQKRAAKPGPSASTNSASQAPVR